MSERTRSGSNSWGTGLGEAMSRRAPFVLVCHVSTTFGFCKFCPRTPPKLASEAAALGAGPLRDKWRFPSNGNERGPLLAA